MDRRAREANGKEAEMTRAESECEKEGEHGECVRDGEVEPGRTLRKRRGE